MLFYIVSPEELTKKDIVFLKKMMRVFFLGQLMGLPTLKSILTRIQKKSNNSQINYTKLCKKMSNNRLRMIFEFYFESVVANKLKELAQKDSSNWSRQIVTAVIDDSVFRQWLQSVDAAKDFEQCYGSFFSGQYGRSVFGYKVVTFGLSIEGIFYPMYFECAKKKDKTKNEQVLKATEVAVNLVKRWNKFRQKLESRAVQLPSISISCDSGYSDLELAKTCAASNLRYISVPKKSHLFDIKGKKWKLSEFIKKIVISLENKHLKNNLTPFTYRARATYRSKGMDVVLLFFRLNGSKKISVVYTTDKTMHAKTIRRHWFQRTYIEQFFRWLKHVLKIQQATTKTKHQFEFKLFRFAFMALHAQLLVRLIRKKYKQYRHVGFQVLQRQLTAEPDIMNMINQSMV